MKGDVVGAAVMVSNEEAYEAKALYAVGYADPPDVAE